MGRPHRRGSETDIHHVMNRGVDHQPIFFADADRLELGCRLADIHERFGVATLAYCLMTNHFHLVLRAPDGVAARGHAPPHQRLQPARERPSRA